MIRKRNFILDLFLLVIFVIIIAFVYLFLSIFASKDEKLYYIPQVDIYLKTIRYPKVMYDDILLSKNREFSLEDNIDCIKKQKSEISDIRFYIDPSMRSNKIFIEDTYHYVLEINQVNFIFEKTTLFDTTLFEYKTDTRFYKFKQLYYTINVDARSKVFIPDPIDKGYIKKVEPIEKKRSLCVLSNCP